MFESFLSIFMLFSLLHIIIILNPSSFAIFFSWRPILHPHHLHPIFACKARFTYTTKQQQAVRKISQRLECSIDMVWAMLSTGRSMQQLHWQTYEQPASPFWDEPAWSLGALSHLTMHHARLDSPSSMQSAIHWVLKSWSSSWQVQLSRERLLVLRKLSQREREREYLVEVRDGWHEGEMEERVAKCECMEPSMVRAQR